MNNNKNYSYSVKIDVKEAIERGWDSLNGQDLMILSLMRKFINSGNCRYLVKFNGEVYYRITCKFILDQLPILRIDSKRALQRHIAKLIDAGAVERIMNNCYPFYKVTPQPKYEKSKVIKDSIDFSNEFDESFIDNERIPYNEQLNDVRWKKYRDTIFRLLGRRCRHCGSTSNLQVHHLSYISDGRYAWQYPLSMVRVLCRDCHEYIHSFVEPD